MSRYRLNIAYDGTAYAGWQIQPNGDTVQARLEEAIREITNTVVRVHGSGRTDAGVHARAQVAHFDLDWPRAERQLIPGLNAKLPDDIRASNLLPVADAFHAQHDTTRKEYRYHVWNGRVVPPFLHLYRARYPTPLDDRAMRAAADHLEGEHDFAAFSANPNEEREGTVRTIYEIELVRDGEDLCIRVVGNGFLYKMVRSLTGWLLDVGRGKFAPAQTREVLTSKTRTEDVLTAPAKGLFLWQVTYPT